MTKIPFAESRRLLVVMESLSVIRKGKRKRNSRKNWKVMERNNSKNTAHVHGWDEMKRQVRAALSHVV